MGPDAELDDSNSASKRAGQVVKNKYFRDNPGKSGMVFPEGGSSGHPYFSSLDLEKLEPLSYNMKRTVDLYQDPGRFPTHRQRLSSKDEARTFYETLPKVNGKVHLPSAIPNLPVGFSQDAVDHILRKKKDGEARWSFFPDIPDALADPDEVWFSRYNEDGVGTLQMRFVKWYQDWPMVVVVNASTVGPEIETAFEGFTSKGKLNDLSHIRKGPLMYRK